MLILALILICAGLSGQLLSAYNYFSTDNTYEQGGWALIGLAASVLALCGSSLI